VKVALVFGGGGVKAAAHVGAGRAVAEAGLTPVHYVGTSMGAVMAAAFASGLAPQDIAARMAGVKVEDVARPLAGAGQQGLAAPALFEIEPLRGVIEQIVPLRTFAEMTTPLTVTAVDLDSGDLALFGAGGRDIPVVDALLASCSLPFFYSPVIIAGRRYADGGLRAVLPLEPAAASGADAVIAVDTGPGFDEPEARPATGLSLVEAHNSATGILMASNTRAAVDLWRATPGRPRLVYVRPRVERNVTFRVDLAAKYAEEGYRATREALAEIRK
jgi:NTE family protein